MIIDKVNAFLSTEGKPLDQALLEEVGKLSQYAFGRQFGPREAKEPGIWFSSIGGCLRQEAYKLLKFEPNGKEADSRSKIVFLMGDLVEICVLALAKAAGCHIEGTGMAQKKAAFDGMTGRPDGILLEGSERILVEVKSMASYTFERFEKGELDDKYRYQCNAGMEAEGLVRTCVVALNKDAGVLGEQVIHKDPAIVADIRDRIKTLKAITYEALPERFCKADGKGFYPWQAAYCQWWKTCLPNAEKVLVRNSNKIKEKTNATTAA